MSGEQAGMASVTGSQRNQSCNLIWLSEEMAALSWRLGGAVSISGKPRRR